MPHNPIKIGSIECGLSKRLLVIAGPCVIESEQLSLNIAERLADIATRLDINLIFKASFDKANRTSVDAFRGPGLKDGLAVLEKVHTKTGLMVTTDIHEPHQAAPAGEICDVLQIPAFLCRQTDLLVAAAESGAIVNVKKGQFLSPDEMRDVVAKLHEAKCEDVILTFCFM